MKKPRSDAKLLNLAEEQKAQLADWLLSGVPYHRVRELLEKEFKVEVSLSTISAFYDAYCAAELIVRRKRAVSTADEIADEAAATPGRFDAATIDALKQKAFELSINPGADPKEIKSLFMLVLKSRDQDLDERQLKLDREKFEFDAAKAALKKLPELKAIAGNKTLDENAKLTQIRMKLFGEIPE